MKCRVFVDFDGTIATVDTTDFSSSALPRPHGATSRRSGRRAASARASAWCARSIWCARRPPQMDAFIRTDRDRPGFAGFVAAVPPARPRARLWCRTGSIAPSGRCSIATASTFPTSPITCSGAATTAGGWRFRMPERLRVAGRQLQMQLRRRPAARAATSWSATAAPISVWRAAPTSCWPRARCSSTAATADLPHIAFENFDEATALLAAWLEERGAAAAEESARPSRRVSRQEREVMGCTNQYAGPRATPPRSARSTSSELRGELLELEDKYCSHGDTVHYTNPPKIFDRCEGSFIYDAEGREFLDLQMWYSAVNFGYRNPRLERCRAPPARPAAAGRVPVSASREDRARRADRPGCREEVRRRRAACISTSAAARRSRTASSSCATSRRARA